MAGLIFGAVVVFALFFGMCWLGTGSDEKNMKSYYSYPDAVQEKIRQDEKLKAMIPKKKSLLSTYLSNIILFTIVFLVLGVIIRIKPFFSDLWYFLIVGEALNVFDLAVIDACWWRNAARTKFKVIPDKALYRDMKKHIGSFVRGIPVFAVAAILSAGILSVFNL